MQGQEAIYYEVPIFAPVRHGRYRAQEMLISNCPFFPPDTQAISEGAQAEYQWMADLEEYGKKYPKEHDEFKVLPFSVSLLFCLELLSNQERAEGWIRTKVV
jgi:hypothetical protein